MKTNSLRLFNPSHLFYIPPFHIVYALGDVNGDEHEDEDKRIKDQMKMMIRRIR